MAYSGATGIAPTGVMATGALGDAPAPTAPPMVGGISQTVRIVVRDSVTGLVVIDDLPHLHQSSFDNVGFQPGATGRSAIGTWSVKLFPVGSDGYKNAKTYYDLLQPAGQRIEVYLGDIIAGNPRFTGLVKAMTKSFSEFTISGDDSLALLQSASSGRNEVFSGRTDQLATYALKGFDLTFGDDFSAGLGNFTNDGGWTTTTDLGRSAIQPGTTGDYLLYTTASYGNAFYADCSIKVPFRMVCEPVASGFAALGIVGALTDTNNLILGEFVIRFETTNQYALDLNIWQKSGGSYGTVKKNLARAFVIPGNVFPGTLELKGYQSGPNTYLWRLLVNGADPGCFWIQNVSSGAPTGSIGVRSPKLGASLREQVYIPGLPTGIAFWSKTNWFQPGRISLGTQSVNQAIPDTPQIDLLQLAATTEGGEYRKNPKAGLNADTIDFGLTVGDDLSATVRFEEGVNVVDASIEPNWESFGTNAQSSGLPSMGGAGWTEIPNIAAIKLYGNRGVSVPAARISDVLAQRFFAQQIVGLTSNPGKAKRVTVRRDEWADRVRELDVVELHLPSFGIFHARAKVVGYIFKEGAGTTEFLLDQYPRYLDRVPELDRLQANVRTLMTRSAEVTATDPANPGQIVRDSRATLPINPWKMRVYQAGAQNISKDAVTKILFDTVTTDTSNGFSVANGNYTVQATGFYVIDAAVSFAQPNEANQWQYWIAFIYVNGALAKQGTTTEFLEPGIAVSVAQCSATVSDNCYFLNAGDVVDIRFVVHVAAATVPVATGTTYTAWSMHLISA